MADRKAHCRAMLIAICPEMFRPMAEMMIPLVLPDMPDEDLMVIEEKLEEACLETDEVARANILIEFIKGNGGKIDFSIIPPELRMMLPVG